MTDNYTRMKEEFLPARGTFTVKDLEDFLGVGETTARKLVKDGITNGRVKNGRTRGTYDSLVPEIAFVNLDESSMPPIPPQDEFGGDVKKRHYTYQPKDDRDARDARVLDAIKANGPCSRNDVDGYLGDYTAAQVYLSIWRLHKAGVIKRVSIGRTYPGWVKA